MDTHSIIEAAFSGCDEEAALSEGVENAYVRYNLGTVGGAAALIAEENILESEVVDYPELGMEAVRLIRVVDLPAFLIVDDKSRELYARLTAGKQP